MKSRQKLGQHFLKDKVALRRIAEALKLKAGDTIVEIGPGHGELTTNLKSQISNLKITAIEKDKKLAEFLEKKFSSDKNVEIIEGDALKILKTLTYKLINLKTYKLAGNIPYYLTGKLLRIIGELEPKPKLVVLTVQKEVAERVCAKPPKMNLLAAAVQFWGEPEITASIPKSAFSPPPKVDGAIIKLTPKTQHLKPETYYSFIKIIFKQPRKTILNNLLSGIENRESGITSRSRERVIEELRKAGVNPQDRPQNLSVDGLSRLSTLF